MNNNISKNPYINSFIVRIARQWQATLIIASVALLIGNFVREIVPPGLPTLNADSALYMHGGWWMSQGGVPYVDF